MTWGTCRDLKLEVKQTVCVLLRCDGAGDQRTPRDLCGALPCSACETPPGRGAERTESQPTVPCNVLSVFAASWLSGSRLGKSPPIADVWLRVSRSCNLQAPDDRAHRYARRPIRTTTVLPMQALRRRGVIVTSHRCIPVVACGVDVQDPRLASQPVPATEIPVYSGTFLPPTPWLISDVPLSGHGN